MKLTSNPRHQLDLFPLQLRLKTGESYESFPGILQNQKEKKRVLISTFFSRSNSEIFVDYITRPFSRIKDKLSHRNFAGVAWFDKVTHWPCGNESQNIIAVIHAVGTLPLFARAHTCHTSWGPTLSSSAEAFSFLENSLLCFPIGNLISELKQARAYARGQCNSVFVCMGSGKNKPDVP